MKHSLLDTYKTDNLSRAMQLWKRIGQVGFAIFIIGLTILQLNDYKVEGSALIDFTTIVTGIGLLLGIVSFSIIAMVSMNKTKNNTAAQAAGKTLLKISLYLYLPAIIIAIILFAIFGLPPYERR